MIISLIPAVFGAFALAGCALMGAGVPILALIYAASLVPTLLLVLRAVLLDLPRRDSFLE